MAMFNSEFSIFKSALLTEIPEPVDVKLVWVNKAEPVPERSTILPLEDIVEFEKIESPWPLMETALVTFEMFNWSKAQVPAQFTSIVGADSSTSPAKVKSTILLDCKLVA